MCNCLECAKVVKSWELGVRPDWFFLHRHTFSSKKEKSPPIFLGYSIFFVPL